MEIPGASDANRYSTKSNTLRSKRGYGTAAAAAAGQHPRTAYLVKTASGFGFTLADTESGQMVKLTADQLGRGQLKSGDVIVAIGDDDVSRETHLNVVSMLKSYPAGSTARISFIRPADGNRVRRRRARSTVPDSLFHGSVHSQSSSVIAPSHPSFSQRPTSQNPEAANGRTADRAPMELKTPRTPGAVLPRSSSLSYSSKASSRTQPVKLEEERPDGLQQRADEDLMRNAIALRKSLPAYEVQRQYWMSLSPTNSSLNFSGTPDYIPASVYSLSSTNSGGDAHREMKTKKKTLLSSSSIEAARPLDSATRIADRLDELNFRTDSALTVSEYSRMSEVEGDRRTNSISNESNAHSANTKLLQKEEAGNKRHRMRFGSMGRKSSRKHQTSNSRHDENSATVVQATTSSSAGNGTTLVYGKIDHDKGTLSSVDRQNPVYSLEIHRGSRGFGFSIRGGKEFRGMPLLVLNIAKGGPADTDGRLKNGDQILSINGFETKDMTHKRAIELIQSATSPISLTMKRTSADATAAAAR